MAVTFGDRQRLLSRIVDEFERRGWREDGQAALALVSMLARSGSEPSSEDVDRAVGRRFQVQNAVGPAEIRAALLRAQQASGPLARATFRLSRGAGEIGDLNSEI